MGHSEIQPSSNEAEGDFIMCEVEEQQAARVEVQSPKRRAVIRVESEKTKDYVRKQSTYEDFSPEEVNEIGFVQSASSELRGAIDFTRCRRCCRCHFVAAALPTGGLPSTTRCTELTVTALLKLTISSP